MTTKLMARPYERTDREAEGRIFSTIPSVVRWGSPLLVLVLVLMMRWKPSARALLY